MKAQAIEVDFGWRQRGVSAGRGWWQFVNGTPCRGCGSSAMFEKGGNGKAGSGERWCAYCRRVGKAA